MNALSSAEKQRHSSLVAEDRAAGARRRRVDRQHRNLVALCDQRHPERIDGGGFTDARRAGDADADRVARQRKQLLHQIARLRLMIGAAAFYQRNGAGQRRAVAGANVGGEAGTRYRDSSREPAWAKWFHPSLTPPLRWNAQAAR
jgi:hypothetical protein